MLPKKLSPIFGFALALILGSFAVAKAQGTSVAITPAYVDAQVKRGTAYSKNFTITNNTKARLLFNCSVADYWYDEQNKRVEGRPGTFPRSASTWVQFSPTEVVVEPNSSASVKLLITVPSGAAGGYYAAPVFEAKPLSSEPNGNSIRTSVGISIHGVLMLTTADAAEYNVEIMGGRLKPPTASSELEMQLDVRNRGTAHARVRGVYALLDAAGKFAGRGKMKDKNLMPGQRTAYQSWWAGQLAPGRYVAVVTLSYDRVGAEPATVVYELPFEVKQDAQPAAN
jgi:hypothetical protein